MIGLAENNSHRARDVIQPPDAVRDECGTADVGIVSTLDLNQLGGLETYVRSLTEALTSSGQHITWNGQSPSKAYRYDPSWQHLNRKLLSLMTRRNLRWMSRKISERIGNQQCDAWLNDTKVMHFVGTGWNLLGFPAVRAAKQRGMVATCWPAIHPGQWGDSDLDFDLYSRMDAIFVQSDHEKELFVSRGIDRDRLVRCDLAPSVEMNGDGQAFKERHGLTGRQVVLFLGRKCPLKGYHAVRSAIGLMHRQGRPVTLVSIGTDIGGDHPSLPIEADVDLGRVDDQEKANALAACDVMALPSTVESFGIVYTEAWAYGKPVVCGPSPASQELVSRHGAGLTGSMVPEELAKTLERLLDDHGLRSRMGRAGLEAVRSELSWNAVEQLHRQTWQRLQ